MTLEYMVDGTRIEEEGNEQVVRPNAKAVLVVPAKDKYIRLVRIKSVIFLYLNKLTNYTITHQSRCTVNDSWLR